ncbi:hypothetical protein K1719_018330 [Acacia pycnantha]|nr:hypothetical protein K1719_018330 [Acacia pycnantha]
MSSSVGAKILEKLRSDAMRGRWSEVFETCKQNRFLYAEKITGTGDTVLHMAVSNGQEKLVANALKFSVKGGDLESRIVNIVLRAENDRKNTPLHLAAVKGKVEMCKKIGRTDPSLIARHNISGETPLFLAALYGRKEAFLWLHYLYMEFREVSSTDLAHCIRDDNSTILHGAIAEGHFDVAIEIIHLYKDILKEMMRPNKEGLSPLHLLAAKPSAFKTPALLERSFLVPLIYWSLKVEEKNQATTREELGKKNPENRFFKRIKFKYGLLPFVPLFPLLAFFAPGYIYLLFFIPVLLLPFFQTGTWFREMQKKKEKHIWSLQIMNKLLCHCSDEDMSRIISRTSSQQLSISLQIEEFNESDSMATSLSGGITIDTPLMIAAKNGVVEMVERILELFPSTIKDVNAEGKNIVLLAVEYMQTEVFRFLCKQKWLSQSLFGQVDKEGNNALHLAASLGVDIDWLNPEKINWFKFVKKSMPRGLSQRYNRKMETPEDIFRERHKELMKRNGEWAAKTSQACSVVSTLVASVAYATCTNVPGDYDDKGYANHRNKPPVFKIFGVSSFLALLFSLISTIFFLSIVASPSQSVHSWRYVPAKLCFGVYFMFLSIVCLWISFCAGHFFILDDKSKNSGNPLLLYIVVTSGIILLVVSQIPIFFGYHFFSLLRTPIPRRNATRPIEYRRTTKNKENGTDWSHQN